ncbi:MAG: VWA domain-containing protein [Acidobacteria bacterium]|nr:MAG: VWA domain-containing protein [Acidobacteriota bacterium]
MNAPQVRHVITLALLLPALSVATASSQEDATSTFGDVIDVRVVNIEVVVTDRDGNRVYGLGPEDFRLRVDDREVPVEYFTEIQGGQAVTAQGSGGGDGLLPVYAAGETVGNSYLVFIDDYFAIGAQRNQVLKRLREQLPRLRPEDRMAVVAFDGKNLELLTSWTQSQRALERAFDEAQRRPASGIRRRVERAGGFGGFGGGGIQASRESRSQLERLTTAVVSTLRSFAQPPGRKVMLLLSGGWPTGTFTENGQPLVGAAQTDLTITRRITETANLVGYTLYPIDLPGLQARLDRAPSSPIGQILSAQFADNPLERLRVVTPDGSGALNDVIRLKVLDTLARETGGRAMLFADRLAALPQVVEDTSSYYWLGFTPDRQHDDVRHRIEVEVLRPGLTARARRGFRDLSRRSEVTMMAQSALLFGDPTALSSLSVEVGQVERKGWSKMAVPVRIGIPAEAITLLPQQRGYVAEIELRMAVKDSSGAQSEIPVVPLRLSAEHLPSPGELLYYDADLKLRRKPHDLVVSVHDVASGNVLTSMVVVEP